MVTGIYFPKLCSNRGNIQVDAVGQIRADVWSWGHIFPQSLANKVNFQVDSVGPIGSDVWSWGHILYRILCKHNNISSRLKRANRG